MLGFGSKHPPTEKIETIIGPNTNFSGRMVCDGSVRIDGVCESGEIETIGNIVVGPDAKVGATLIAENVSVSGAVTGNIRASGRLEILSTGKVWGDADVGSFLRDDGGYFEGKLVTGEKIPPPSFTQEEPAPAADGEADAESDEPEPDA